MGDNDFGGAFGGGGGYDFGSTSSSAESGGSSGGNYFKSDSGGLSIAMWALLVFGLLAAVFIYKRF